jgi:hypothetical protein
MRLLLILPALLLLLAAPPADAEEGVSLYRSLQEKGNAPEKSRRQGKAPANGFVDRMREKGIEPIPSATRPPRTEAPSAMTPGTAAPPREKPKSAFGPPGNDAPARPDTPAGQPPATPSPTFSGRVQPDGRGGFRMFDAMGRPIQTLTPDGRGGFRVYDASGRFQGRVTNK